VLSAESRSLLAQLIPLVRREIPHEHGSTTCAYKGVSGVNISNFFCLPQLRRVLPFVCVPILALLRLDRCGSRFIYVLQNLCSLDRITLESFNRRLEQKHLCIALPFVRIHLFKLERRGLSFHIFS
jgi:hypothetical protein